MAATSDGPAVVRVPDGHDTNHPSRQRLESARVTRERPLVDQRSERFPPDRFPVLAELTLN